MHGKDILMLALVGVGGYFLYEWWMGSQASASTTTPTPTPGTTPTMNQSGTPTSVSTAPTTTPSTTGSTTPSVQQPTATDLQNQLKMTLATADQWNYAYSQLTGFTIDQLFKFSFDKVYGAVVNGVRNNGQLITAQAFLTMPGAFGYSPQALSGLSAISTFYTPVVSPVGSMIYRAQHPSPYRYPMSGLGAFTQATGFEKALFGGRTLRRMR